MKDIWIKFPVLQCNDSGLAYKDAFGEDGLHPSFSITFRREKLSNIESYEEVPNGVMVNLLAEDLYAIIDINDLDKYFTPETINYSDAGKYYINE